MEGIPFAPKKQSSRTGSRQQRTSRKILVPKGCHCLQIKCLQPSWSLHTASELWQACPSSQPPAPSLEEVYGICFQAILLLHEVDKLATLSGQEKRQMPSFSSQPFLGKGVYVVKAKPLPCLSVTPTPWLPLRS